MENKCPKCGSPYTADQAGGLCPKCLADVAAHPTGEPVEELPLTIGQTFHGMEVLEFIGRGGMGVVYKARQPHLERPVALKILPRKLASDPEFRQRFEREARSLAGLTHPNIVGVYDFGFEGDLSFLVMEFVDGVNLRRVLCERKLIAAEAMRIVPQLCDALQYAHGEGVVHRDIKPENILLDKKGRVKIADFGLAKIVGGEMTRRETITQSNVALGTPNYMAPEQLENPKEVDHRADIYSMGVVFYEMLTGELPIGKFEPPSRKVEVDVRLDEVVLKTLEKAPDRRYQHASEVKEDVTRISERAPRAESSSRWKGIAIASIATSTLSVLAVVVIAILFQRQRPAQPAPVASDRGKPARSTTDEIIELRRHLVEARKKLLEIEQEKPDPKELNFDNRHRDALMTAQRNCDAIEHELARLEERPPHYLRPYDYDPPMEPPKELTIDDVVLYEKDIPDGYRWQDAVQKMGSVEEWPEKWSLNAASDRVFQFRLRDVQIFGMSVSYLDDLRCYASEIRVNSRHRPVEVLTNGLVLVAILSLKDSSVASTRLFNALVAKMREKMGLPRVDPPAESLKLPTRDFFQNRRGGTSTLQDLVFDPKRPRAYVSDHGTGEVEVFSTVEHRLIQRIPVGSKPHGMDVDAEGMYLYVAVAGEGRVVAIDLEQSAIRKTISTGGRPYSVRLLKRTDGDRLAVARADDPPSIQIFELEKGILEETLPGVPYPLLLGATGSDCFWNVGRGQDNQTETAYLSYDPKGREPDRRLEKLNSTRGDVSGAALTGPKELTVTLRDAVKLRRVSMAGAGFKSFDLPEGPGGALAPGPNGNLFASIGSREIAIFDDLRRHVRSAYLDSATDPFPGLFASPDGKWLYIISGDRLGRSALPLAETPAWQWLEALGRSADARAMELLRRMEPSPQDPRAKELAAGPTPFDDLLEQIEKSKDGALPIRLLVVLTLAKRTSYAEKLKSWAGKWDRDADIELAHYYLDSGAAGDETLRHWVSRTFRSVAAKSVLRFDHGVAQEKGGLDACEDAILDLEASLATVQRIDEFMTPAVSGASWIQLSHLVGYGEFNVPEWGSAPSVAVSQLKNWWFQNRDHLKWNAEKKVFQRTP